MAKRKKHLNFFELVSAIIVIVILTYNTFRESRGIEKTYNPIEIHFIDVGQADAILIKSEGGCALIDAGNNEDGPKLVDYLEGLDVQKLDYAIGTHAHEDHIGGMDNIINSFEIKTFYMPDVVTTTKTFEDVLDALDNKGYAFKTPKIGETFKIGDALATILYVGTDESDLNDTSIIMRLDHGQNSFLFTGDASKEVEEKLLKENIEVDVLKVAHHGSKYSSTKNFLEKVNPTYAVISVGVDNSYNHPSNEIVKRLEKLGTKIYRTDNEGTIIMKSDGNHLEIEKVKTDTDGNAR